MRITIGIPVYNKSRYLRKCLNSVLNQDFDDYEILIWDDGSTDNSGAICDMYAEKYKGIIRVKHVENAGPLIARYNIALEAKGDYIYFIDADDELIDMSFFSTIIDTVDRTGADVVIFRLCGLKTNLPPRLTKESVLRYLLDGRMTYSLCDKCYSRRLIHGDWDYSSYVGMRLGEDLMLLLDILKEARKVVSIDKEFYRYRMVDNSSIHSFDWRYYYSVPALRKKLLEYLDCQIRIDEIDRRKRGYFSKRIDCFVLSDITALARKIKWIKGTGRYQEKKAYLEMICNGREFRETVNMVKYLPLKRRMVVYALKHKLFFVMDLAFKLF